MRRCGAAGNGLRERAQCGARALSCGRQQQRRARRTAVAAPRRGCAASRAQARRRSGRHNPQRTPPSRHNTAAPAAVAASRCSVCRCARATRLVTARLRHEPTRRNDQARLRRNGTCFAHHASPLCSVPPQCRAAELRISARVALACAWRCIAFAACARAAAALTSTTTAAPCPCRHRRSCRPAEHAVTFQRTRGVQRAHEHASERKTRAKGKGTHHHDHRRKRRAGHAAIERQQVAGPRRAAGEASMGVSGQASVRCDKERDSERDSERT